MSMTYLKIKISIKRSFNRHEICLLMCFSLIKIAYEQRSHFQSIMSMTYLKIKISTERSFKKHEMCLLMCFLLIRITYERKSHLQSILSMTYLKIKILIKKIIQQTWNVIFDMFAVVQNIVQTKISFSINYVYDVFENKNLNKQIIKCKIVFLY
jgi:hypothetical protein